jgi:hypothetical protein
MRDSKNFEDPNFNQPKFEKNIFIRHNIKYTKILENYPI